MQRKWRLTLSGVLFFCVGALAQQVNTDSLKLVSRISQDQLQLGKLQNQVEGKTRDKRDAADQAQKSARDNADAASKLSASPQDKALARKADNSASTARTDAHRARRAAERLDDLNKDIQDTKDKIAKEQQNLSKYTQVQPVPVQPTPVAPPVRDTMQRVRDTAQ